mmetsp:Transcript_18328/g.31201  ORF Transcript_18328/g.31201 Transcript_18328/m.31201 type:complete len:157 (+) Transcript_18328:49-519(+)
MLARLYLLVLALAQTSHALQIGLLGSARACTRAAPRMLFGGGGNNDGGGGMGGMNMMETIKKAQQVGVKVKELQEELQNTEVEATAADGQVTVTVSGAQVPLEVTVSEELLAKGAEAVSEAVSLAAKEAHKNSMDYAKDRMSALYGEIGLPMPPEA